MTDRSGMRIYDDPFEELLAQVVKDWVKELNKQIPLTFTPDVVYLEHDKETRQTLPRLERQTRDCDFPEGADT